MKKQTTILVLIGVILFIAGSAIAFASVKGASKHASGTGTAAAPVSTAAVVAKANIPAGTTGQAMLSERLVAIEPVPSTSFSPGDLTSLQALSDEVLSSPVQKGHAINASELNASTSSLSIPQGYDAVTVSISGAGNLAGYLQPGAHVDIYANITKTTSSPTASALPTPCTALVMTDIQVLDVQSTSPSLSGTKGASTSGGRSVPSSETLLLAATANQSRTLQFLTQNEALSVVQPQQDTNPPPVGQCIGSGQIVSAP